MKANIFNWSVIDNSAIYFTLESNLNLIVNSDNSIYFDYCGVIVAKLRKNSCKYSTDATNKAKTLIRYYLKAIKEGKLKLL